MYTTNPRGHTREKCLDTDVRLRQCYPPNDINNVEVDTGYKSNSQKLVHLGQDWPIYRGFYEHTVTPAPPPLGGHTVLIFKPAKDGISVPGHATYCVPNMFRDFVFGLLASASILYTSMHQANQEDSICVEHSWSGDQPRPWSGRNRDRRCFSFPPSK